MTNLGTVTIETDRLILRKFKITDAYSVYTNWANDEEIQNLMFDPICDTKETATQFISDYIRQYDNKEYYRWAIILKNTDECIGQIAFFLVKTRFDLAEIEYCIGKSFQNKGYATEATNGIMNFGFNILGLNRIQISHMEGNINSKKVIEKLGFKYEGTFREYFKNQQGRFDRIYYGLLRKEYLKGD